MKNKNMVEDTANKNKEITDKEKQDKIKSSEDGQKIQIRDNYRNACDDEGKSFKSKQKGLDKMN
jgi:CTP-dependent riboflavin kinase